MDVLQLLSNGVGADWENGCWIRGNGGGVRKEGKEGRERERQREREREREKKKGKGCRGLGFDFS